MAPPATHGGPPDRHHVVALRHLAPHAAVGPLVLEEQHRVVVADGRFEQALASYGVLGVTTFRPGTWQKNASTLCEWYSPPWTPGPYGARITSGQPNAPLLR